MILLAPDKFKGTLTAAEVASTIASALRECGITEEIITLAMADGGEGTAEALSANAINEMKGCYRLQDDDFLVVTSEIVGHGCFDLQDQSVCDRSSYNLGAAIQRLIANYSANHIYVAVGGTATSDGGAGFLQALGATFSCGTEAITEPITPSLLLTVTDIALPHSTFATLSDKLVGLIDVHAGLYSGEISALTFAPQKGASQSDVSIIYKALQNLSHLIGEDRRSDYDGAGGGIGYAIASVIGANCLSGAEFILTKADLDWQNISLVITGEGSIDNQTSAGKVVNAVCNAAKTHKIEYLAIGGRVSQDIQNPAYISTMLPNEQPPISPREASSRLRRTIITHFTEKH